MDRQLRCLPVYSIKRFGLENESEGALSTDSSRVIDYINQMLLRDEVDENSDALFCDPTALTAAENYFNEALGENSSSHSNVTSPKDILAVTSSSDVEPVTNDFLYGFGSAHSAPNISFDDKIASILQSPRGVEEAKKFFPTINRMVINFDDKYSFFLFLTRKGKPPKSVGQMPGNICRLLLI
ncbi:unnamed protein product [Cuscuta epithymum]|uniref:Uncharacterized protein n=1 Tax=Cuscuta epithymum TaxID=186058 RepID=A0AAV0DYD9_9ASTE|nr:unnamed protein product [Cuscuta epithymum]